MTYIFYTQIKNHISNKIQFKKEESHLDKAKRNRYAQAIVFVERLDI
jgi:uncharacterized protein (DUF362 family)